jgi:hypothetical protein
MEFMPNYQDRPDKWHLLIPDLFFYPFLLLILLWNIIDKALKATRLELSAILLACLLGLTLLNDPKGYSQPIGYFIVLALCLVSIFRLSYWTEKRVS